MADKELEQGLEELESVKQTFKSNINAKGVSTSNIEFRDYPSLLNQMEKVLPKQIVTISPTTSEQSVMADVGYKLEQVKVNAVTSDIDSNIQSKNIKQGISILGVQGSLVQSSGSPKFGELVEGKIQTIEEADLSEVAIIRDGVFEGLTTLKSVAIPSNVTTIGDSAFSGCIGITELSFAEGVQTIGDSAFSGINTITLTIPASVTEIGASAFANSSLTEITMAGTIPPTIGENALPDSVTAIYVIYGAYDDYVSSWIAYADKIVRLPAIPSTITVTVNNYLGELVSGASVTITGNGQTYTGTTNDNGVFTQGDLQPATYTISVADLDGFKTPDTQDVVVEEDTQNSVTITYLEMPAFVVDPVFANNSPAVISQVSALISSNNMTSAEVEATYGWKVGDTTSYTHSDGEPIQIRITDFNHDDKSDGTGKAGINLEMTHCLRTLYAINSNTNILSFSDSDMNKTHLPNIKTLIPQEWQDVMVKVNKKCAIYGNQSSVNTISTDLFLISETEMFGTTQATGFRPLAEGSQYAYWVGKSATDRDKKDTDGVIRRTWFRTMLSSNSKQYLTGLQGNTSAYYMNYTAGVSYAFCV